MFYTAPKAATHTTARTLVGLYKKNGNLVRGGFGGRGLKTASSALPVSSFADEEDGVVAVPVVT